ncbi:pantothenate kinase [Leptotrichia sp. OH3620_COT-345]|uniref:pantothenate kinase n=1 Tax=Leptotrichia sp. OH3620_COT-345 TaxID=2491048 RepID=UPI000F64BB78|nr:pantothenate kinase [Leptotrichia sp. OH3620_COT-345]RRD40611.1 pantothenate kinase [Leptotrichia sp. OH3620_COT-345]
MKKNKSKLLLTVIISVMLVGVLSCGKENNKVKNSLNAEKIEKQSAQEQAGEKNTEEEFTGLGINKEFKTDGKLHEEKFLNKQFMYPDSNGNSFKIEKDKKGYFITYYYIEESSNSEEEYTEKVEKSRLKLHKNVYLIDEEGIHAYGYDTALKNVVILNARDNFRIIYEAEKPE